MQHDRKIERGFDYVRNIIAAQYNTAFGNKKKWDGKKIMRLSYDDYEKELLIPSKEEYSKMFKSWKVNEN